MNPANRPLLLQKLKLNRSQLKTSQSPALSAQNYPIPGEYGLVAHASRIDLDFRSVSLRQTPGKIIEETGNIRLAKHRNDPGVLANSAIPRMPAPDTIFTKSHWGMISRYGFEETGSLQGTHDQADNHIGRPLPAKVLAYDGLRLAFLKMAGIKFDEFQAIYRGYHLGVQREGYRFTRDILAAAIKCKNAFSRIVLEEPVELMHQVQQRFFKEGNMVYVESTIDLNYCPVYMEYQVNTVDSVSGANVTQTQNQRYRLNAQVTTIHSLDIGKDSSNHIHPSFQLEQIQFAGPHRKLLEFLSMKAFTGPGVVKDFQMLLLDAQSRESGEEFAPELTGWEKMQQFYQAHPYWFGAMRGLMLASAVLACLLKFEKREMAEVFSNADASAALLGVIALGSFIAGWHVDKLFALLSACASSLMQLAHCCRAKPTATASPGAVVSNPINAAAIAIDMASAAAPELPSFAKGFSERLTALEPAPTVNVAARNGLATGRQVRVVRAPRFSARPPLPRENTASNVLSLQAASPQRAASRPIHPRALAGTDLIGAEVSHENGANRLASFAASFRVVPVPIARSSNTGSVFHDVILGRGTTPLPPEHSAGTGLV